MCLGIFTIGCQNLYERGNDCYLLSAELMNPVGECTSAAPAIHVHPLAFSMQSCHLLLGFQALLQNILPKNHDLYETTIRTPCDASCSVYGSSGVL